jgi:hypothetical protein
MKIWGVSLALVLYVCATMTAQEKKPHQVPAPPPVQKPALLITIGVPNTTARAGSEVILNVVTKNISDRVLYRLETSADAFFGRNLQTDVRDSKGMWVLETPYGRKRHGTDPNRPPFEGSIFSDRVPFKPGERLEEKIVLSEEYDLNKVGTYTVYVLRSDVLSETDNKFSKVPAVKSATITLNLIP